MAGACQQLVTTRPAPWLVWRMRWFGEIWEGVGLKDLPLRSFGAF